MAVAVGLTLLMMALPAFAYGTLRAALTWSLTPPMHVARNGHTATLLLNGTVLVVGGYNGRNNTVALASVEIYHPLTHTWTGIGSLHTARYLHTATLLSNGAVLVAGGAGRSMQALASAELYDPRSGRWMITGSMTTARGYCTATRLRDGRVLVVGGANTTVPALASAELYDPGTGRWSITGLLTTGRYAHTATLLNNGMVLVTGGRDAANTPLSSAELYNPRTGLWTTTGSMHARRWNHTATLLRDGRVLVAGDPAIIVLNALHVRWDRLPSAELYNSRTQQWTVTGSMITQRSDATATLLSNGTVLVTGGSCGATIGANGKQIDPRCLAVLSSAEIYAPRSGRWRLTGAMHVARLNANATLLPDGTVLVTGGIGDSANVLASADVYDGLAHNQRPH